MLCRFVYTCIYTRIRKRMNHLMFLEVVANNDIVSFIFVIITKIIFSTGLDKIYIGKPIIEHILINGRVKNVTVNQYNIVLTPVLVKVMFMFT